MAVFDVFITILLAAILLASAFIFGMKTSDRYHEEAEANQKYALQRQYVRLTSGIDADDDKQPYVAPPVKQRFRVNNEFVDRLHKTGSATCQVNKPGA